MLNGNVDREVGGRSLEDDLQLSTPLADGDVFRFVWKDDGCEVLRNGESLGVVWGSVNAKIVPFLNSFRHLDVTISLF